MDEPGIRKAEERQPVSGKCLSEHSGVHGNGSEQRRVSGCRTSCHEHQRFISGRSLLYSTWRGNGRSRVRRVLSGQRGAGRNDYRAVLQGNIRGSASFPETAKKKERSEAAMKIRYQAGILAAALSLSMATAAFAASSSTTGMAGGNSSDRPNKIGSQVVGGTNGSGTRSSGTMSGNSNTGSNVKFVDNFGTSISANQIVQVNEGLASVQSLPSDADLAGYNPLVRIQNMETTVQTNGQPVEFSIYVPNLVENLNNVQVLILNSSTGKWELVAPAGIDPVTKMVTVSLNFTGPMTVVYK